MNAGTLIWCHLDDEVGELPGVLVRTTAQGFLRVELVLPSGGSVETVVARATVRARRVSEAPA